MIKRVNLQTKIIIGLLLGIIFGFALNMAGGLKCEPLSLYVFPLLTFVGNLFIKLIRMCVVPLVFFSIAEGVANLGDVSRLRSVGKYTFIYIIATGIISAGLGAALGLIFRPGVGASAIIQHVETITATDSPGIYNVLLGFFTTNPFEALAKADMMPVITFSIFCGVAMMSTGPKGERVREAFGNVAGIVSEIVNIVLLATPYGTFALIANTVGKFGAALAGPILKFLALDWCGQIIIQVVVFNFILIFLAKVSPMGFWKRAIEPWVITFTTGSSNAALPVNMKLAEEMGIPKRISAFVLPIGCTANMNGICCFLGLLAVFAAQAYNIPLSFDAAAFIVFECVILAVGTAAVPAGGLIMSATLFTVLGFPLEVVAIVAGVYKIVDGIHTTSNSVGDLLISVAVANHEGVLDKDKYYNNVPA